MDYLIRRLQQVSATGLMPYVVDSQGRLVAAATPQYATGQDMSHFESVRSFVGEGSKAQLAATREFTVSDGKTTTEMLGTYSPVTSLDWAVVVQKPREDAYRGIYEMQRTGRLLAWLAVFVSVGLSIFSARRITSPLQVLAQSSRARMNRKPSTWFRSRATRSIIRPKGSCASTAAARAAKSGSPSPKVCRRATSTWTCCATPWRWTLWIPAACI